MGEADSGERVGPIAMLLFRQGFRPDASQLRRSLISAELPHRIFTPATTAGERVEILREGLTFDLTGLAPGPARPHLPVRYSYGLPKHFPVEPLEAVHLLPGPHLRVGSAQLLPVVRVAAGLLADLAQLSGLVAISWAAAENIVGPQFFARSIRGWRHGGPFPTFSLVSLSRCNNRTITSEGLRGLIGCELRFSPRQGQGQEQEQGAETAFKQAVRLVDWVVMQGRARSCIARLPLVGPVQFDVAPYGELHAVALRDWPAQVGGMSG